MTVLGTGMRGLVGSRLQELLSPQYEFENLDRTSGIDITNQDQLSEAIKNSDSQVVIHLAAKTDVDGCEKDKTLKESGDAWRINVEGTRNVAESCSKFGKKMIYVSTDFVFDGEIAEDEFYTEEDTPNPVNWYARTKYEGEKIVQGLQTPWIIVRLAYPYRAKFEKNDFMRAILNRLEQKQPVAAITDHVFSPTFIDDAVSAVEKLMRSDSEGIFHVVGSQCLTPYDAANIISYEFGLDSSFISKTTREEFFKDRAPRPFRLALKNDKIKRLGIEMRTFQQGLSEIKKQL